MTTNSDRIVQAYLNFNGRCEEAVEFYRTALGAEVEMMLRMKENPEPSSCQTADGEKIMHVSFRIGQTTVMASDCEAGGEPSFKGFSLSICVPEEAEVDRCITALAEGGKVNMPPAKTFWSPRFGIAMDRFGVCWMVQVMPPEAQS